MNKEPEWERVAAVAEVAADRPAGAASRGRDLVLVHSRAGIRAFEGACPHRGTLLSEGAIAGSEIVCRAHGWRFDCETGQRRGPEDRPSLVAVPCRVRGGAVEVSPSLQSSSKLQAHRTLGDLPGPPGWPLVGNMIQLRPAVFLQTLESWAARYGSMYRVAFGRRAVLIVSDAKLIEDILRRRPASFRRAPLIELITRELGTYGVFSSEGETWRRERRLAMAALAGPNLRAFYPTLVRMAERLKKRWTVAASEGRPVSILGDFRRFTVDVTTNLAFGNDMNTLETEEVIQNHLSSIISTVHRRLFAPFPYWQWVKLAADRRVDAARAAIGRILEALMAGARAKFERLPEPERVPQNFLEAMVLARDDDGRAFSDETIAGNLLTLLITGDDTTSNVLAWIVHELLERPAVRSRLVAEVDGVLGGSAIPLDLETTNRLDYVDAVANETMRFRQIVPLLSLEANEDVVIDGVSLPRGSGIFPLFRPPALDDRHFGDARSFRPERWVEPPPGAHVVESHMPFGSGPRFCPGRGLALLEIRLVLAMLMKSFELERVGDRSAVKEVYAMHLKPEPLTVRFHTRGARG
jgi:cytochrome P450/nitrite reductase/ring-hydroxylating ferredoxin subunit